MILRLRLLMREIATLTGLALICIALLLPRTAHAQQQVDVELVFMADASLSIDDAEITFQRQGYADALLHAEVQVAIKRGALGKIAVTFIEWADDKTQDVVVPWMVIDGLKSAQAFSRALLAPQRTAYGMNAIGAALAAGQKQIETNAYDGLRRIIDFSGDSANNWSGISIEEARANVLRAGITINGLAVLCRDDDCGGSPVAYDLAEAFEKLIIGGPGSFVVTADSNNSFATAVRRKLILELASGRFPGRG